MSIDFGDLRRSWDETSMNDLRRMWPNPDHTARTIGKLLGFSRNAIIAKAHRMGLTKDGKKAITYAKTRSAFPRNPKPPKPRLPQLWRAIPMRPSEPAPLSYSAPPSPRNVPLNDLKPGQCRWPMWGSDAQTGFFCGSDALTQLPYCSGHCAMAYQPRKKRMLEAAE